MNAKWKACIIGGALLASLTGTAAARDNVSFSLSFGVPAHTYYAPPPPVYYAPPAYYAPAPVAYYAPPPPQYYVTQPVWGFTVRDGHRRGWDRRHHRNWR